MEINGELLAVASALGELAVKGTATSVAAKIRAVKDEKDAAKLRNTYDEIVNELLSEREEAIRIAQVYKAELEKVEISDEDIEHLHNTVASLLGMFKSFQLSEANAKGSSPNELDRIQNQSNVFEQMKELISVDTLKTMQLLGFNYKAAIGEPLTKICAEAITKIGNKKKNK